MTPLEAALRYAAADSVPIFPCKNVPGTSKQHKSPHTPRGYCDASLDQGVIETWWRRWPSALCGMPTGRVSGRWVLDIDVKRPEANGFDSLEDLGYGPLPETPMVHTESGGLHVYYDTGGRELRNSAGLIGPGLDVRGDGGYVILPTPSASCEWDPIYGPDTPLAPAPSWLWPPKPSRPISTEPIKPVTGLSRYGEAAINAACYAIVRAGPGEQEQILNAECFSIGTLAGAGAVPADITLRALLRAAASMPDHDSRWPWRPEEIDFKVKRAFDHGVAHPREVRRVRVA